MLYETFFKSVPRIVWNSHFPNARCFCRPVGMSSPSDCLFFCKLDSTFKPWELEGQANLARSTGC